MSLSSMPSQLELNRRFLKKFTHAQIEDKVNARRDQVPEYRRMLLECKVSEDEDGVVFDSSHPSWTQLIMLVKEREKLAMEGKLQIPIVPFNDISPQSTEDSERIIITAPETTSTPREAATTDHTMPDTHRVPPPRPAHPHARSHPRVVTGGASHLAHSDVVPRPASPATAAPAAPPLPARTRLHPHSTTSSASTSASTASSASHSPSPALSNASLSDGLPSALSALPLSPSVATVFAPIALPQPSVSAIASLCVELLSVEEAHVLGELELYPLYGELLHYTTHRDIGECPLLKHYLDARYGGDYSLPLALERRAPRTPAASAPSVATGAGGGTADMAIAPAYPFHPLFLLLPPEVLVHACPLTLATLPPHLSLAPSPSVSAIARHCRQHGIPHALRPLVWHVLLGAARRDTRGDYNRRVALSRRRPVTPAAHTPRSGAPQARMGVVSGAHGSHGMGMGLGGAASAELSASLALLPGYPACALDDTVNPNDLACATSVAALATLTSAGGLAAGSPSPSPSLSRTASPVPGPSVSAGALPAVSAPPSIPAPASADLASYRVVAVDAVRTLPHVPFFADGTVRQLLGDALVRYCSAAGCEYKQGLNYLLAPLLLARMPVWATVGGAALPPLASEDTPDRDAVADATAARASVSEDNFTTNTRLQVSLPATDNSLLDPSTLLRAPHPALSPLYTPALALALRADRSNITSELSMLVGHIAPNVYADNDFYSLQCMFHMFRLLLQYHDATLAAVLDAADVGPELYASSWLLTLHVNKTRRLDALVAAWDLLLCHLNEDGLLHVYFSLALLLSHRDALLDTPDISLPERLSSLELLSPDHARVLLAQALELRSRTPVTFTLLLHQLCTERFPAPGDATDLEQAFAHRSELRILQSLPCLYISPQELVSHCYANHRVIRKDEHASLFSDSEGPDVRGPTASPHPASPRAAPTPTAARSAPHYFILDTRHKHEYNKGHLPCSLNLDPATLRSEDDLQATLAMLLVMCDSGDGLVGSSHNNTHFTVLYSSERAAGVQLAMQLCYVLLARGCQYVSLCQWGYDAVHDMCVAQGHLLIDHNADECALCLASSGAGAGDLGMGLGKGAYLGNARGYHGSGPGDGEAGRTYRGSQLSQLSQPRRGSVAANSAGSASALPGVSPSPLSMSLSEFDRDEVGAGMPGMRSPHGVQSDGGVIARDEALDGLNHVSARLPQAEASRRGSVATTPATTTAAAGGGGFTRASRLLSVDADDDYDDCEVEGLGAGDDAAGTEDDGFEALPTALFAENKACRCALVRFPDVLLCPEDLPSGVNPHHAREVAKYAERYGDGGVGGVPLRRNQWGERAGGAAAKGGDGGKERSKGARFLSNVGSLFHARTNTMLTNMKSKLFHKDDREQHSRGDPTPASGHTPSSGPVAAQPRSPSSSPPTTARTVAANGQSNATIPATATSATAASDAAATAPVLPTSVPAADLVPPPIPQRSPAPRAAPDTPTSSALALGATPAPASTRAASVQGSRLQRPVSLRARRKLNTANDDILPDSLTLLPPRSLLLAAAMTNVRNVSVGGEVLRSSLQACLGELVSVALDMSAPAFATSVGKRPSRTTADKGSESGLSLFGGAGLFGSDKGPSAAATHTIRVDGARVKFAHISAQALGEAAADSADSGSDSEDENDVLRNGVWRPVRVPTRAAESVRALERLETCAEEGELAGVADAEDDSVADADVMRRSPTHARTRSMSVSTSSAQAYHRGLTLHGAVVLVALARASQRYILCSDAVGAGAYHVDAGGEVEAEADGHAAENLFAPFHAKNGEYVGVVTHVAQSASAPASPAGSAAAPRYLYGYRQADVLAHALSAVAASLRGLVSASVGYLELEDTRVDAVAGEECAVAGDIINEGEADAREIGGDATAPALLSRLPLLQLLPSQSLPVALTTASTPVFLFAPLLDTAALPDIAPALLHLAEMGVGHERVVLLCLAATRPLLWALDMRWPELRVVALAIDDVDEEVAHALRDASGDRAVDCNRTPVVPDTAVCVGAAAGVADCHPHIVPGIDSLCARYLGTTPL